MWLELVLGFWVMILTLFIWRLIANREFYEQIRALRRWFLQFKTIWEAGKPTSPHAPIGYPHPPPPPPPPTSSSMPDPHHHIWQANPIYGPETRLVTPPPEPEKHTYSAVATASGLTRGTGKMKLHEWEVSQPNVTVDRVVPTTKPHRTTTTTSSGRRARGKRMLPRSYSCAGCRSVLSPEEMIHTGTSTSHMPVYYCHPCIDRRTRPTPLSSSSSSSSSSVHLPRMISTT